MSVSFREAVLDNGLKIIAEVDPNAHTTAAGFWISTGARDEESRLMGISHFLEHMMFKGSENRNAEQVNRDFDDLGAVNNAFTSAEMTAYWIHLLPEHLEQGVRILADILRPSLRQEDFDSEKEVIIEEIAMYEDQPFWVLYEHAMARFYGDHPLAHRVLGTRDTVGALTRDEMAGYFHARYSSDNTTLAAAGALDFDALVELARETCGEWKPTGPTRVRPERVDLVDKSLLEIPSLTQAYLLMLAPAPDATSLDRYPAGMLAHTLGGYDSSRLYWSLVESGIAEEAQCSFDGRDGAGEYATWAVCAPESIEKVEGMILEEIDTLPEKLVQDDLDRARARIATGALIASERPLGRMNRIAACWLRQQEYVPLEEEMKRIDAITVEDLRVCADKFPITPSVTSTALGDTKKK
jgi:predicted Zn-dependent peptidase